ncbi:deoxyribose-phosphate aldolase [Sporosarcina sp.]|uniref:deoxyribose-phosphate aldolase n=1 Tax=Sporosarcina sp. TaxID=49982 RepID=UPI00260FCFC2|nr:deoxyribose-phosphate aldolase [Sporosarcina sp.]
MTVVNEYIDHTLLKAEATKEQVEKLCREATEYHFAAVCVNPVYVTLCTEQLKETEVNVCTVIGFPLGANRVDVKKFEAERAIADGAQEIDYVLNISAVKNQDFDLVEDEMNEMAALKRKYPNIVLKCIFEICYLTSDEIIKLSTMAKDTELDFIKTSTGFGSGGATEEAVQIMDKYSGDKIKVKASGGVRTLKQFETYKKLGVSRIGTSNGVAIMNNTSGSQNY